ncbi:conserved exported hypothetical protein [Rubrivivax sp. A210]|uniref:outer membrane beta-barrel protein n=1 Tax=Rubrivivax sp. A210 TaxID=2772301 RepID=UPI001919E737|nr:outer membrane beta-barrel protein [Rubrivivax sp. A210]CAD5370127.1 conserved exported hypothetical protein [Rubrivivax sp. A210]
MKPKLPSRHWLLAGALAAAACAAQAQSAPRAGPFMVAAVGRSDYNYDCYIFADCSNARATSGKLGFGYRFGTFAVEGWWSDFGRGNTNDPGGSLRLQGLGASASWLMRFGEVAEGLLRAGLADTRYTRTRFGDRTTASEFQPTFGLGIGFIVTPQISVELAWDVTRGDAPDTGTVLVNAASVGLRLRF